MATKKKVSTITLADVLKTARGATPWSLSEAAKNLGLTKSHLYALEAGKATNPCLTFLKAAKKIYGLSSEQLV
jgi:transcriptional regulator with XRE-family HTH domain